MENSVPPGVYDYPGAHDQETYDVENRIADPNQRIESFIERLAPFEGRMVADIGAGGGFHACRYAARAKHVFAIEPAPAMLKQLYARVANRGQTNLSILAAGAENIPLRDNLLDIIHSRFAYFFGPERPGVRSCEPGIAEGFRVLKPGGYFFVVDNTLTSGQFAELLDRYGYTNGRSRQINEDNDTFWSAHGFQHVNIGSSWTASDRDELRRVIAMEFQRKADAIMADISGTSLTYHYRVYYRQKPRIEALETYVFEPYDNAFPYLFFKERERLLEYLAGDYDIEHVGSTAVPNLGGKGIIDITIAVSKDEMTSISKMVQRAGYQFVGGISSGDRLFHYNDLPDVTKGIRRYHLQVTNIASAEYANAVDFRDYLRLHSQALIEYEAIKKEAATRHLRHQDHYSEMKRAFIQSVLDTARRHTQ